MYCDICGRKNECPANAECKTKPRLNAGSGLMLKKEYINFDTKACEHHGMKTDILGDLNDLEKIFKPDTFENIVAFHVVEHFEDALAVELLRKFFLLVRKGGTVAVETPDVIGLYKTYYENPETRDEETLMTHLYGNRQHWDDVGFHMSGWTQQRMAKAMESVGFKITHTGVGLSHGFGARDLKVVGVKP